MSHQPVSLAATQPTTPNPTAASAGATGSNMLNGNDFMTLLVAQLKHQDPTNPMDPTQFVSQLVSFNSLEQLIGIKQDLDSATASAAPSGAPNNSSAPSGAPGNAAPSANPAVNASASRPQAPRF